MGRRKTTERTTPRDEFGLAWDLPDDWSEVPAEPERVDKTVVRLEPAAERLQRGQPERDPREDAAWFRKLSAEEQDEARARWKWEEQRFAEFDRWHRRERWASIRDGVALMTLGQIVQVGGTSPAALAAAAGIGFVLGGLWFMTEAGRILRAVSVAGVFFGLQFSLGAWRGASLLDPGPVVFLMFGGLAVIVGAAFTGLMRESRLLGQ